MYFPYFNHINFRKEGKKASFLFQKKYKMIIQNLDTIFLKVDPDTKEVFLPKERFLSGRKVSYLIPIFANAKLSVATDQIALVDEQYMNNIYIDAYEKGKDYKTKNFVLAHLIPSTNNVRYKLDCILDFDLSVVKIKNQITASNKYIAFCAVYTNEAQKIATNTTKALTLFAAPTTGAAKIKLSEIGGYMLNNKLIKQIVTVNDENTYITIRTRDNKNNINDLPLYLLNNETQFNDNNITFDSLNIDTDNSYLTITAAKANKTILTFKY